MANHPQSIVKQSKKEVPNKVVYCDRLNCNFIATRKIDVNAGKFGFVSLNVCNNCIKIFELRAVA